jgi:hypothetical protein
MIMMDQSERLSQPLRWTRAGKLAVIAVVACLVLGMAGLGIHALTTPGRAGAEQGCIEATFPSTLGAASLYACGARARSICASPGAYKGIEDLMRETCGRAGYAYDTARTRPS